jgi:transcriptional regulator of acetoin/glycerol metabolism
MATLQQIDALETARRHLLSYGVVPEGLVSELLSGSWQRCLAAGLDPMIESETIHASSRQLDQAKNRQRELLDHAMPAMSYIHSQTRDTGSVIVLSNAEGLLLQSCGDADFLGRASRVKLAPGAFWQESQRGTNAIGTTLQLGVPTVITGAEHFLECNGFLTCAAAPVSDSRGQLLGVLDISSDYRSYHPHTFGLIRAAAQMIENRLFMSRHGGDIRLRFHPLAEGIGTLAEGVLAVNRDGCVVGANPAALTLLSLISADLGKTSIDQVLATRLATLVDWVVRRVDEPIFLPQRNRPGLFVRIELSRSPVIVPVYSPPAQAKGIYRQPPSDALQLLDTGDERMATAIARARRIMCKDIHLLVEGESGVGKELFAKAIHQSSPRSNKEFVAVNCAALPENLIEAELFGYTGGAYTGARREGSPGRIREADGGTLFLDEIGDMPLSMQGRLLRVLQEKVVQPLGGGRAVSVDFSLICATHCRLKDAVDAGSFRADLYYRINGLTLILPPLRERCDFNRLLVSLLDGIEPGRDVVLSPSVARAFSSHHWPGNLRQLSNALRTACALLDDGEYRIGWEHLPDDLVTDIRQGISESLPAVHHKSLHSQAEQAILRTVDMVKGNIAEASRILGISRNTLYRRLQKIRKSGP